MIRRNNLGDVNIGSVIESKFRLSKMTVREFAAKLNCNRSTVSDIFDHNSIDINRLIVISEILNFDFVHACCWKYIPPCPGMCMIKGIIGFIEHTHESVSEMFNHDVNIGAVIRQHLKEHKISQLDFAGFLGCDISVVQATLKRKSIDVKNLVEICIVLNTDFINMLYVKDKAFDLDASILIIENAITAAKVDIAKPRYTFGEN
jgi:transcriptional regulator with XRE-family HTH domain